MDFCTQLQWVKEKGEHALSMLASPHKELALNSQPVEPPQFTGCFSKNDASIQFGRAQAA